MTTMTLLSVFIRITLAPTIKVVPLWAEKIVHPSSYTLPRL